MLLGAACVLGVVAFYSFEHSPASIPAPALALYVPPSAGLRPAVLPGQMTVQEGPPSIMAPVGSPEARMPAAMMPIPAEAPVTLPSVMVPMPAVKPIEKEELSGAVQMLLWAVAASSVMGVAITRKRIY